MSTPFKHLALVYRGGALQARGRNHGTVHAETSALGKLWPNKRKGTVVYSLRHTKTGKLAMAKPCPECEAYLRRNGVSVVVYSTREGTLERIRL